MKWDLMEYLLGGGWLFLNWFDFSCFSYIPENVLGLRGLGYSRLVWRRKPRFGWSWFYSLQFANVFVIIIPFRVGGLFGYTQHSDYDLRVLVWDCIDYEHETGSATTCFRTLGSVLGGGFVLPPHAGVYCTCTHALWLRRKLIYYIYCCLAR